MYVDPQLIQIICLVAYGVLPFVLSTVAIWLNSRNMRCRYAIAVAAMSAICGVIAAVAVLSNVQLSKYPETDFAFGVVFVIWFAVVGAIIGAIIDRLRFGGPRA